MWNPVGLSHRLQPALETLLAFKHLVQTFARLGTPFTTTRIRCTFGFQRLRERRCECEILFPNPGVFPQMSHTDAIRPRRLPAEERRGFRGDDP